MEITSRDGSSIIQDKDGNTTHINGQAVESKAVIAEKTDASESQPAAPAKAKKEVKKNGNAE